MQKKNVIVYLLIFDLDQNDVELLVSLLRNLGKVICVYCIMLEEDLEEILKVSNWDLLLVWDLEQEFSVDDVFVMIWWLDKDILFILLIQEENWECIVVMFKVGVQDMVFFEYID